MFCVFQDRVTLNLRPSVLTRCNSFRYLLESYIRRIFYPRMKYPPLAFSPVNLCKIDVFTLNMMALPHKMSQTINNNENTKWLKNIFIV